jgi:hypothetical protein
MISNHHCHSKGRLSACFTETRFSSETIDSFSFSRGSTSRTQMPQPESAFQHEGGLRRLLWNCRVNSESKCARSSERPSRSRASHRDPKLEIRRHNEGHPSRRQRSEARERLTSRSAECKKWRQSRRRLPLISVKKLANAAGSRATNPTGKRSLVRRVLMICKDFRGQGARRVTLRTMN